MDDQNYARGPEQAQRLRPSPAPGHINTGAPPTCVANVVQQAAELLDEAHRQVDELLIRVRGPSPEKSEPGMNAPCAGILDEAVLVRDRTRSLNSKLLALSSLI